MICRTDIAFVPEISPDAQAMSASLEDLAAHEAKVANECREG